MFRRLTLAAAAIATAATMLPANAAPGSTTLYFANVQEGSATGCTPVYALTKTQTDGGECSGTVIAVQGNGLIQNDTYASEKKLGTLKIDASKPLTGTVWVKHFAAANIAGLPPALPGYVELDITFKIGSTTVGTVTASGPALPVTGLKVPVSLPIPASLKGSSVTKVTAAVTWSTAVGLSGISYTAPEASFITIPTL